MKCIVFTTYIPTEDKIWIGLEFLDKFVEKFKDYDIYIGDSNSCEEWLEVLEGYNPDMELIVNYKPKMMVKTHGVIGTYEQLFESIAEIVKDADYEVEQVT